MYRHEDLHSSPTVSSSFHISGCVSAKLPTVPDNKKQWNVVHTENKKPEQDTNLIQNISLISGIFDPEILAGLTKRP